MKTGCWKFISSLEALKKFSMQFGIDAVRDHFKECPRCSSNYEIRQKEFFCTLNLRSLPSGSN